jgi:hypothetical protein
VKDYAVKGKKIDEEAARFATIDRGKDHWWLLVRAWRKNGSSRLLAYEQIPTFERLKAALELYEIQPQFTLQDCGFEKQKVLQECADNGWIAVHGLPNIDSFVHVVKDRYGKKIREERRLYSDFEYLALGQRAGKKCSIPEREARFSNGKRTSKTSTAGTARHTRSVRLWLSG